MKTIKKANARIATGFFFMVFMACQTQSHDFKALNDYLKSELNYTKSVQNQEVLIVSLNTCHVCTDRIADNLRKKEKNKLLLIIITANAQKDIDNYLNSNSLTGKFEVIPDLESGLFNQPFYDGSTGYFFKVGKSKIEKMIRFDINHNFEVFEKELITTN